MSDLLFKISPAQKALDRLDNLDLQLERDFSSGAVNLTEYHKMKYILEIKRIKAFKRVEREMIGFDDMPDPPAPAPPEPDPPATAPATHWKTTALHIAIFWAWFFAVWLIFVKFFTKN